MSKGKILTTVSAALLAVSAGLFMARDYLGITDIPVAELKARYSADARYVDVLGAQVRIKESGQGEPLLLLHGFAASADTWDGWRQQLGNRYRVIAIDVAPFAITGPVPGRPTTAAEIQAFLDALVAKLGLTQLYLAGNSMGGMHAWNFALRHPEQVKKLILVDSSGYPNEAPLPVKMMRTPGVRKLTENLSPRFLVEQSVRDVYGDPTKVSAAQVTLYHDMIRREGARAAVADLMSSLQVDAAAIKQVSVPTLILWGGRDKWIPREHAEFFHRDIRGSQLIVYDELGHVPMEEDPARTAADVERFLQSATADMKASL